MSPSHMAPPLVGASAVSGSSPTVHGLRPTNATVQPSITAPPTPVSYKNGEPVFAANASLPPGYDHGVLSLAYLGGNCSMGRPPWNYNAKSCSCVVSAAKWQYNHPTATMTMRNCPPTVSGTLDSDKQSLDCSYYGVSELATPFAAPADCCNRCDIRASKVQFIY